MSYDESMTAHHAYLQRKYFPELDGLRALAVLLVITVHLYDSGERWRWLAGHRGVTLFFVLSGYLITTLALREETQHGRLSLAAFYVRRCFRIFPLYYFTLGLYCLLILGLGLSSHLRGPLVDALPYYLLYLQEVPFCLWQVLTTRDLVLFHSWTLGAEEKFYLLWPLLAFVLWRGEERLRRAGTALLAIGFALIPVVLTPFGPEPRVVGRMLFCYCSLLTGCLLAFLLHDRLIFVRLRRLSGGAAMTAALFLLLLAHFATPWVTQPSWADGMNVLYTAAVGLFLTCLLVGEGPVQRVLRWRPLTAIGRLSYGIYLLHLLALNVVSRLVPKPAGVAESVLVCVLTSLVSIVFAWLMHRSLESFGINLGRRWSRRILERAAQRRRTTHASLSQTGSQRDVPALAGTRGRTGTTALSS